MHRDGDWHRAFHCWIVSHGPAGAPGIVLQQRAPGKDTWGSLWDVSVAGHYASGEGIDGGIREIQEELGLDVRPEDLLHLGWRREEVFFESGLIEREIQDVYFLGRDVRLSDLRSDRREVTGVAFVPLPAFRGLTGGERAAVSVQGGRVTETGRVVDDRVDLAPEDLVPRARSYYARVCRTAHRLVAGHLVGQGRRWP